MSTLYCNLFGGPGTGKSTTAAGLFYKLKTNGHNAELIQEYAKDKVWGEDYKPLTFQPYILGKQLYRQYRLLDKVDVAVTDSPIVLSLLYKGFGCVEGFDELVVKQFHLFNNLNIFLKRNPDDHPYNPKGRSQTEDEAKQIDKDNLKVLKDHDIKFETILVSKDGRHINKIFELVESRL
jgi:nicotinamide riboside kinase